MVKRRVIKKLSITATLEYDIRMGKVLDVLVATDREELEGPTDEMTRGRVDHSQ